MFWFLYLGNRAGFWSAMTSNLANQSRNVLSKKFMVKKEVILLIVLFIWHHIYRCGNISYLHFLQESLDNITLFSIITIMSFFLFTPVALLVEGVKFTPAYLQSAVSINKNQILICYFTTIFKCWLIIIIRVLRRLDLDHFSFIYLGTFYLSSKALLENKSTVFTFY